MKLSNNNVITDLLSNAKKMVDEGFPVDAIPYYADAARILEEKGSLESTAECYEHIGYCYELDSRWSEAHELYNKAKNTYLRSGDEIKAKQADGAAIYAQSQST